MIEKVKVKTDTGLDNCSIKLIQQIEDDLDEAMIKNGKFII